MSDLRTKINELPILEDKEQIDTILAIGKDGKTYRIDGSNVGGSGSKLTPINGYYDYRGSNGGYYGYMELNEDDIDHILQTGGSIHILLLIRGTVHDIELNLFNNPTESSISTLSTIPDINNTYNIAFAMKEFDIGCYIVAELYYKMPMPEPQVIDNNIQTYDINQSYYELDLYIISDEIIENINSAVESNDTANIPNCWKSPNSILYGKYPTEDIRFDEILNICIEEKPIFSQNKLITCLVEEPQ